MDSTLLELFRGGQLLQRYSVKRPIVYQQSAAPRSLVAQFCYQLLLERATFVLCYNKFSSNQRYHHSFVMDQPYYSLYQLVVEQSQRAGGSRVVAVALLSYCSVMYYYSPPESSTTVEQQCPLVSHLAGLFSRRYYETDHSMDSSKDAFILLSTSTSNRPCSFSSVSVQYKWGGGSCMQSSAVLLRFPCKKFRSSNKGNETHIL